MISTLGGSGVDPLFLIAQLREHEGEAGEVARQELARFEQFALSDVFVVAVVGEFKRGKSTLLNALLGENLLPTDVTPTTATVNLLRFAAEPSLSVHQSDGAVVSREFSSEALWDFTAEADFDPDSIDYIEIGLPSPILKHGLLLVDTPGVNDLNEHRSDVAYRFLPRADAVIFLLSATNPVVRSEKEFLQTSILQEGLTKIAFVATFADELDEDHPEAVCSRIKNRISTAIGLSEINLFLTAAPLALESAESREASGVVAVENYLTDLVASDDRVAIRKARLLHRAAATASVIASDFRQRVALSNQTIEGLSQELAYIDAALGRKTNRLKALDDWLADREAEVSAMTRKSLRVFQDETKEALLDAVETYTGADFKTFVETTIPNRLRQYCKMWLESHAAPLSALLFQLDTQIVNALGSEFEEVVSRLRPEKEFRLEQDGDVLKLQADDVSQTSLRTGLIAGGAATLLLLMGAGMFVPIIGMAGLPFLSKAMTEQHLKQAKQKLRPQLAESLDQVFGTFSDRVIAAVTDNVRELRDTAVLRYEQLLGELKARVELEIAGRKTSQSEAAYISETLEERIQKLQSFITECTSVTAS